MHKVNNKSPTLVVTPWTTLKLLNKSKVQELINNDAKDSQDWEVKLTTP